MARDFRDFVNELSARSNIVRIASDYTRLKKQGSRYVGLCPFHEERTPSFTLNAEKNLYHCFGCGAGGNIYGFVMAMEGVGFQEAVKIIAQRSGIPVPVFKSFEKKEPGLEEHLCELNESAASWFFQNLMKNEDAFEYLRKRGVAEDTLRKYRLGYAPDTWDGLLIHIKKQGLGSDILHKSGLFVVGRDNELYDLFRGRIIFPIHNHEGRIIGFGGRTVKDDNVKYLNSPETPLFHKSRNLFGLYLASKAIREQDCAVLVEGYFDQLMLWQGGIKNTVAPLGTALNRQGTALLKRYTDKVIVAFDSDEAGRQASMRALAPLLSSGFSVRFMTSCVGKDPDEFIQEKGPEAVRTAIAESVDMFNFTVDSCLSGINKNDARNIVSAADKIIGYFQNIADAAEKEIYLRKLADKLGLSDEVVLKKAKRGFFPKMTDTKAEARDDIHQSFLDERKLVRTLTDGVSWHKDEIQELLDLNAVSTTIADVLRAICDLFESGAPVSASSVADILDDEMSHFFTGIIVEEYSYKDLPEKELEECFKSIKRRYYKKLVEEEKKRLKNASEEMKDTEIEEILKKIQELACQIEKLS